MQLTADLNGAGAVALVLGDFDRAMLYFSSALTTFNMDDSRWRSGYRDFQAANLQPSRLPTGLAMSGLRDDIMHVFDQTLIFDGNSSLYNLNGVARDCCITGILFFNMALCLHLKGRRLGSTESLKDALQYYDKCAQALSLIPASDHKNASIAVFLLAVWNNQGVISFYLHEGESSRNLFQRVHSLASALLRNKAWDSPTFAAERNRIYQFVLNSIVAGAPIAAACA